MIHKSIANIGRWPFFGRWLRSTFETAQLMDKCHPYLKNMKKKYNKSRRFFWSHDLLKLMKIKHEPRPSSLAYVTLYHRPYKQIIEDIFGPGSFNDVYYNYSTQAAIIPHQDSSLKNCTNDYLSSIRTLSENDNNTNLIHYYSNVQDFKDHEDIILFRKIIDGKDIDYFTTQFKEEEEKLEQKKEFINDEQINTIELDFLKPHTLNIKKVKNDKRSGGTDEMDKVLDQLATRCLNSPTDKIDEQLLTEMKNCGAPSMSYKKRNRIVDKNIMQTDIKNADKERPVDLEFTTVSQPNGLKTLVMGQVQLYMCKLTQALFPRSVDVRKY